MRYHHVLNFLNSKTRKVRESKGKLSVNSGIAMIKDKEKAFKNHYESLKNETIPNIRHYSPDWDIDDRLIKNQERHRRRLPYPKQLLIKELKIMKELQEGMYNLNR